MGSLWALGATATIGRTRHALWDSAYKGCGTGAVPADLPVGVHGRYVR
jgi:hypothetical protein